MMVTDTPLETIFQIIADNAFTVNDSVNGVFNPDDPLFIGLNLNTRLKRLKFIPSGVFLCLAYDR